MAAMGKGLQWGVWVSAPLWLGFGAHAEVHQWVVGHFSALPQEGRLPEGWEPLEFEKIKEHTRYLHLVEEGRGVIEAQSRASSSGLIYKGEIDPLAWPVISWSWKVDRVLDGGDATQKSGDDYPARLYISFAYDGDQVGFWEKMKFKTIKLFYGEYPPVNALCYIWANRIPKESLIASPYTERLRMIAVESGAGHVGSWRYESRNIIEDYQRAFGAEPPAIAAIAIMTDTDNTGEVATSWYGDIILSRP
jgi:hypothetical protein